MDNGSEVPQKIEAELPCDLVILLLGIYSKEMKLLFCRPICNSMFIAAQFIIGKTWKQLEHTLLEEF